MRFWGGIKARGKGTVLSSPDHLRRLSSISSGIHTRTYGYHNISSTQTTTQVSSLAYTGISSPITFGYTYDAVGNIATYAQTGDGTVTYTYDSQGQLLEAEGDTTYTYTYDGVGNILTASNGSTSHTYTYGNSTWRDLLTAYDGQSITYDTAGNPTSYYNGTRWTFTWGKQKWLTSATAGGNTINLYYTEDGLRTQKYANGTYYNFIYNNGQLMREYYNNDILDFFYDASGRPFAMNHNGTNYYYILNLQGDVIRLVNASGATVASYEYDPYGKILSATGSMAEINPLRYRGYYYDEETGLYYLMSRYYDPQTGRFLNHDNVFDNDAGFPGFNLFVYCGNNPINRIDISGADSEKVEDLDLADDDVREYGGGGFGISMPHIGSSRGTRNSGGSDSLLCTLDLLGQTFADATSMLFGGQPRSYYYEPVCFIAGTMVYTDGGATPIEQIEVGDVVWAWNEETGDVARKQVVETYVNETNELVHVFVGGEEIVTTPSHPFYSPVKGWTEAVHLRAGDILVLVNGEYVVVEKVQHEILETPVKVYNFQVEGYHTYYVSGTGVLVHNTCRPNSPKKIADNYIESNNINAHAFKNKAGGIPKTQVSRYDIYQDTADKGKLWVGDKTGRIWKETAYYFRELAEKWIK